MRPRLRNRRRPTAISSSVIKRNNYLFEIVNEIAKSASVASTGQLVNDCLESVSQGVGGGDADSAHQGLRIIKLLRPSSGS